MEVQYSDCKSVVDAGRSSFMSCSDGLSTSDFRQKLEKTHPMREEMVKSVFARQTRQFSFDVY